MVLFRAAIGLNRTVVLRFRLHLESLGLAAGTINQRLAAVRRLGYEAADSGLLSPELAAGIRRVKGVKQLGFRAGNWLNRDQARQLLEKSDGESLRSTRDVAMISILLGCGLDEQNWRPRGKKTSSSARDTGNRGPRR
jgi:site-specific recombinase XerC